MGYSVHCPELFSQDHLLNLASSDSGYLKTSIGHLNQTLDVTRSISKYFSNKNKTIVIVNVGGFSENSFCSSDEKKKLYDQVANSLQHIDTSKVELAIQTMPPFSMAF